MKELLSGSIGRFSLKWRIGIINLIQESMIQILIADYGEIKDRCFASEKIVFIRSIFPQYS